MITSKNKKICTSPTCDKKGKEQVNTNFYSTSLTAIFHDKKIPICKSCCIKLFDERGFEGFQQVMKLINKPIYKDIFKGDYRDYIRQVSSLPNYSEHVYEDSTLFGEVNVDAVITMNDDSIEDEVKRYWGLGYTKDEYGYLEYEKTKLTTSFECPDYGMEMIMRDICFINLEIDTLRRERKENSQKTLTNLIDTRSKLMNDANMKPIQSTGADGNDQVTFGTLIRKWENERPIPKPLDDEMKEYIDTYMVGHLAKMEGLHNEMTEKYDREIAKYTINFEDVRKQQDLMDD